MSRPASDASEIGRSVAGSSAGAALSITSRALEELLALAGLQRRAGLAASAEHVELLASEIASLTLDALGSWPT